MVSGWGLGPGRSGRVCPGICILGNADTCTSYVHPVFNPIAPYRYLLPTVYLSVADIVNMELLACGCRTWICLNIARFYEEQCQPSSGFAWPYGPKNTICTAVCQNRCDSYTTLLLCRMDPYSIAHYGH